jgi:hypothetical protein
MTGLIFFWGGAVFVNVGLLRDKWPDHDPETQVFWIIGLFLAGLVSAVVS